MINITTTTKITCIIAILFSICILLTTTPALAAEVSLAWDNSSTPVDGHRVFARKTNQAYDYSRPVWEGNASGCTLIGLEENTEYYFVVRAFAGNIESTNSNEVHYVPPASGSSTPSSSYGDLSSRFTETTLTGGVEYYTDRSYQLTGVPASYRDMEMIMTPNDDRNRTDASGYLTFTMPYDGTVYVAYDSRVNSLPNWMSGFVYTGDVINTSLSSQPSLKIYRRNYSKGAIVNFGGNKAAGFSGGTVSNYFVFYGSSSGGTKTSNNSGLSSRFAETTLTGGVEYYTDRNYQLTVVPSSYDGMEAIITPNDDRNRNDASGYLKFTMPYNGAVYVAYDSRANSLPNWMSGFVNTGDVIKTSLSSQPSLKIYRRNYSNGVIVNFGGNKAAGFSGGTVSNYLVFYGNSVAGSGGGTTTTTGCGLESKFAESKVTVGTYLYTDRDYFITGGVPDWMLGRTIIQTPNDDRKNTSASDYIRFTTPVSYWVYVVFDSRSSSVPNWLSDWEFRSEYKITTSLSSQPYLRLYRKMFNAGECVRLGGNYGPGSSSETRSNYVVVYGN